MRRPTRWTYLRYRLVRVGRQLEILVSPALGAITALLAFGFLWLIISILAVVGLPLLVVLLVIRKPRMTAYDDCHFVSARSPRHAAELITTDPRFYPKGVSR